MRQIIFFDTETTGIPEWKKPSGDECQPRLVQLAAIVADENTGKISQRLDLIVKPDGWVIPDETIEIHGITNEYAHDVGMPEDLVLDMFLCLWDGCKRVAFNTTFDNRIIRIGTKRYCSEDVINKWKAGEYECAMIESRKIIGGSNPKLIDAYKHFTGKDLEDAHSAYADTKACMEVYFAIKGVKQDI